jgi:hypothetical protein
MANRALWDRLFALWIAIGLLWIALAVWCSYQCPELAPIERTFRLVTPDLETQARYDGYDRWVSRLSILARGALAYGLIGGLLFFRRGCVVFVLAAGVVVVSGCVWVDATWLPP